MKIIVCGVEVRTLKWHRMEMMKLFVQLGCEVVALADGLENEWIPFFKDYGIRYRQYYVKRNGTNPIQDIRTIKSLKDIFREEKPDILLTYHAKANIYGLIAAKQANIFNAYAMVGGLGSVFNKSGLRDVLLKMLLSAEYQISFKQAKKVFFQNKDDMKEFISKRLVHPEQTVLINGSGVNLDFYFQQELPEKISFLFVGRLIKDKGIMEYLAAAKEVKRDHPEVVFRIVGSLDTNPSALTEKELSSYVDEGVVSYCGSTDDVRPFLQNCSVFVLPSYREGIPKAALEAMAVGRPLILTDAPGCRELVQEGVNGFKVKVKDAITLRSAMLKFISEPDLIASMGKESRAYAERSYDVRKVNEVICSTIFEYSDKQSIKKED